MDYKIGDKVKYQGRAIKSGTIGEVREIEQNKYVGVLWPGHRLLQWYNPECYSAIVKI